MKYFEMQEHEILEQIRYEKDIGENYVSQERLEIEADMNLIRGKKRKGKEDSIADHTTFSHVRALVARSFRNKMPVTIRADKNGVDRTVKMLNLAFREDEQSSYHKSMRLFKEKDKYSMGLAIIAKTGWDGIYKKNKFEIVNPLLAVPDPYGDYFSGNYRYIGFYSIKDEAQVKDAGYDVASLPDGTWAAKAQKRKEFVGTNMVSEEDTTIYDFYIHFSHYNGVKGWVLTNANVTVIFAHEEIPAGNKLEKKNKDAIKFPFAFYYYDPLRGSFFGDRPANYTRDVQKWKSEMRTLQRDKVKAELFPMYLFNKDYVSGKDLSFGFNKGIPISTGIDGPQVNLSNIVSPVQRDLRVDNTDAMIRAVEEDLSRATSIGPIVQGSNPSRREALGTNKLVQDNTDINLGLNEEIDAIGDEQFVSLWFSGYYQNFTDADKKLVYAGSTTGQQPLNINREDFIYDGNISLSIETFAQGDERQRKEAAAYVQTAPLILQDQTINEASKRITLRRLAKANGISDEAIDEEIPKTPQQKLQEIENDQLKIGVYVPINPDDDDEQHLVAMGDIDPENLMMVVHQNDHQQAALQKIKAPVQGNSQMLNGAMSQAMSQAGSEVLNN